MRRIVQVCAVLWVTAAVSDLSAAPAPSIEDKTLAALGRTPMDVMNSAFAWAAYGEQADAGRESAPPEKASERFASIFRDDAFVFLDDQALVVVGRAAIARAMLDYFKSLRRGAVQRGA